MKNLTLLIPAKNEKESLPKVLDEIKKRDEVLEKYTETIKKLEKEFAKYNKELNEEKKKSVKEIVEKYYNDPDTLAMMIGKRFGFNYSEVE